MNAAWSRADVEAPRRPDPSLGGCSRCVAGGPCARSASAAAFLPRWWAHRVADQTDASMTQGIGVGLFYGFVFTLLPLALLWWGLRTGLALEDALASLVGVALVLALPNLLTLGIVLGRGNAAHAGDRTLDVEAPGFRGAVLAGAIVAVVALIALIVTPAVAPARPPARPPARGRAAEPERRAGPPTLARSPSVRLVARLRISLMVHLYHYEITCRTHTAVPTDDRIPREHPSRPPPVTQPGVRARGAARRRAIVEAALALLGRGGSGAVTHRAVANEAGVPLAATTYYFATKSELVLDAFALAMTEDVTALGAAEPLAGDDPPTVPQVAAWLASLLLGDFDGRPLDPARALRAGARGRTPAGARTAVACVDRRLRARRRTGTGAARLQASRNATPGSSSPRSRA